MTKRARKPRPRTIADWTPDDFRAAGNWKPRKRIVRRGLHELCLRLSIDPKLPDLIMWAQIGKRLVELHPELAAEYYCAPEQPRPKGGRYRARQAATNVRTVVDEIEAAIAAGEPERAARTRIVRQAIDKGRLIADTDRPYRSKAVERELKMRRSNARPNSLRNRMALILTSDQIRRRDKN